MSDGAELNWKTQDKECCGAIYKALEKNQHLLYNIRNR
jgi:hypothetical protein